jgi:hypothetical protein
MKEARKIAKEIAEQIMWDYDSASVGDECNVCVYDDQKISEDDLDEFIEMIEEELGEYEDRDEETLYVRDAWDFDWVRKSVTIELGEVEVEYDEDEETYVYEIAFTPVYRYMCGLSGCDARIITEEEYEDILQRYEVYEEEFEDDDEEDDEYDEDDEDEDEDFESWLTGLAGDDEMSRIEILSGVFDD